MRPEDQPAEGVLVCWGITLEGRKVLLGLALGSRESYESWLAFARDMIARGLRSPALVIADGAPGIWKAVREVWPEALEQRCTVHALRNVTAKLPERHHQEIKARWWKHSTRPAPRARPRRELQSIIDDYKTSYPSAMAVIETDLPALVTHLRFPSASPQADQDHEPPGENVRGGPPAHQGDRPVPRRDLRAVTDLGRAGALMPRLARREDEPQDRRRDRAPTPPAPRHHGRCTSHENTEEVIAA